MAELREEGQVQLTGGGRAYAWVANPAALKR